MGGSYSELEPSLGFEPPLRTASQVRLPLSGRAEWADELMKFTFTFSHLADEML